ncbi:hypothetical protein QFC21_006848 [Naganishia friedmannii]|uniref:Uncharacterized protein n=1 Tax=Naganishia friedmannii TaxID=89922 RepID=A0ACC2UZ40_9TREE|nr:hypothetical protein QFC21_006848 [Naganishia friedmannii]
MLPIIDDLGLSRPFRVGVDITLFIISLFFLERAADVFVDSTAVVGKRFGVPTILVALLTAGAEWEELVVVVSSLATNNPSLALANTLGSSTANILGSFSIGLVFTKMTSTSTFLPITAADTSPHPPHIPAAVRRSENVSAKIYTSILVLITVFIALVGPLKEYLEAKRQGREHKPHATGAGRWVGYTLVALFVLYLSFIAYGIYRGIMVAPEGSDSDSDTSDTSDGPGGEDTTETESEEEDGEEEDTTFERRVQAGRRDLRRARNAHRAGRWTSTENAPLLPSQRRLARRKSTFQITYRLVLSTLFLTLAGYILSTTSASLASQAHVSDSAIGVTLLSIATTLPEKLVAYKSGVKGQRGVLIANTVGSNIFLQTLVLGVIWIVRGSKVVFDTDSRNGMWIDVLVALASSLVLWVVVWGGWYRRSVGVGLFVLYLVYIGSVVLTGRVE